MCGIFCSSNKEMLVKLASLNQYRGAHSYSVYDTATTELTKAFGEFNADAVKDDGEYYVCHVQAPTTAARGLESVHPAASPMGSLLWHNGIVKDYDVKRLQEQFNTDCEWDTQLLLTGLTSPGWTTFLSTVNGSFACILVETDMVYVFRNEISPLFYDKDMNLSSVKFEGSEPVPPNTMFALDLVNKSLNPFVKFETFEQPFFFFGDN